MNGRIFCVFCGTALEEGGGFCTNCGKAVQSGVPAGDTRASGGLKEQVLALACDYLQITETHPQCLEFSNETAARSLLKKVKIKYQATAQLDEANKLVTFWERLTEQSAGFGEAGFSSETFGQKGIDVSKKGAGALLLGGKYGFEYGKVREAVKSLAAQNGWKFKLTLFRPK